MAHEAEEGARELLMKICGAPLATPTWLKRPGKVECGSRWELVRIIYEAVAGKELQLETMPARESRRVDGVFSFENTKFVYELDEVQHFNSFRAATLAHYPTDLRLGFDKAAWLRRCAAKKKLEGGGWSKERPPLFAGANGRHKQRAFRDALADIVPLEHGYGPTVRLDDQVVLTWMHASDAEDRMRAVLQESLLGRNTPPQRQPAP
jgi:hypothetical protein